MIEVPINRITTLNDEQPNMEAPYVLYWMIAFRRVNYNFSLQRAIEWANKLSKPLLIFEICFSIFCNLFLILSFVYFYN